MRLLRGVLAFVFAAALLAAVSASAMAFDSKLEKKTVLFLYHGEEPQSWIVPSGVESVRIEVEGAEGGAGALHGGEGGGGESLAGEFATVPGEELLILVGGEGGEGEAGAPYLGGEGGWPAGGDGGEGVEEFGVGSNPEQGGSGGGGGFSAIAVAGTEEPLEDSLVILAGGGGGGGGAASDGSKGGDGGNGGWLNGEGGEDGSQPTGGNGGSTIFKKGGGGGDSLAAGGEFLEGGGWLQSKPAERPEGGGGGGGYYGGGQGGGFYDPGASGGGGGSSYVAEPYVTHVEEGLIHGIAGNVRIIYNPPGAVEEPKKEKKEDIPPAELLTPQPVIEGTPAVADTLTCDPGPSNGAQYTVTFKWLRDGAPISGADSAAYKVTAADEGHKLQCQVTNADASGSAIGISEPVSVSSSASGELASIGSVKALRSGSVRVAVSCAGAASGSCKVSLKLKAVETLRHGRLIAVSARGKKAKTTKKTVTLASRAVTLTGGQSKTVSLTLNTAGKHLLRSRHALSVSLSATETTGAGKARKIKSATLTLRAPKATPHKGRRGGK